MNIEWVSNIDIEPKRWVILGIEVKDLFYTKRAVVAIGSLRPQTVSRSEVQEWLCEKHFESQTEWQYTTNVQTMVLVFGWLLAARRHRAHTLSNNSPYLRSTTPSATSGKRLKDVCLATQPGTLQTSFDTKHDDRLAHLQCSEGVSRSKRSTIEISRQKVETYGGATLFGSLRLLISSQTRFEISINIRARTSFQSQDKSE